MIARKAATGFWSVPGSRRLSLAPFVLCLAVATFMLLSALVMGAAVPGSHPVQRGLKEQGLPGDQAAVGARPSLPGEYGRDPAVTFRETGLPSGDRWSVTTGVGPLLGSLPVGESPDAVAVDTVNGDVFVVSPGNTVTAINGLTDSIVAAAIPVGSNPSGLAFDPTNGYVYVANSVSNNLTAIDGATAHVAIPSIPVGQYPWGVAFDPQNRLLYVSNFQSNNVTVVNTTTNTVEIPSIPVGSEPQAVAFDPMNGDVYVVNSGGFGSGNLTIINGATNTIAVHSVSLGECSDAVTVDATSDFVYVASSCSNFVTILNASTNAVVVTSLATGPINALAFDSTNGYVYMVDGSYNNFSVLNGATNSIVAPSVPLGSNPTSIAFDPLDSRLFVTIANANDVTILGGSLRISTQSATGTSMVFSEATGELPFSFGPPTGYGVARVSGPGVLSMGLANVSTTTTLRVSFGKLEPVYFHESANGNLDLYFGARWTVELTPVTAGGPAAQTQVTTGPLVFFDFPAGTAMHFTIQGPGPEYKVTPSQGIVHVPTHPFTKVVGFKLLTSFVEFRESGLPSATDWTVTFTSGTSPVFNYSLVESTTAGSMKLALPAGVYTFTISSTTPLFVSPATGTLIVTVPAAIQIVNVTFHD